jgi:hypothetical protein
MASPEFGQEKGKLKDKLFVWAALGLSIVVIGAILIDWVSQTDLLVKAKKATASFLPT